MKVKTIYTSLEHPYSVVSKWLVFEAGTVVILVNIFLFNACAVFADLFISSVQFYIIQLHVLKFLCRNYQKSSWKLPPKCVDCDTQKRICNYCL